MDIARISLDYEIRNKLTKAQCEELQAAVYNNPVFGQQCPFEFTANPESDLFSLKGWTREYVVDFDKILITPVHVIARLRGDLALERVLEERPPAFNETVQVAVPSNALLAITKVRVCENSCTDVISSYLDEGWSILAICPQPNQRRPDYILGKKE